MMQWYETFFDQRYLAFYPSLMQHRVATEDARFVAAALGLQAGDSVLDLGCGIGRHSVALAQQGYQVTGLDLSADMLAQARSTAESCNVHVTWLQRDMRDLEDLEPFAACCCLFTVFGIFGDQEDQEVLYQVSAALQPGGRLLLDLTNFLGYLCRFPPEVWHETDQAIMREINRYDATSGKLITQRTCFRKEGGLFSLPDSYVRAYFPHEISAMLHKAGLRVERIFGALADVPFSWNRSPNQVYLCRKTSTSLP